MVGYKMATKILKTPRKAWNVGNKWTKCVFEVRFFTRCQCRRVEWE